MATVRYLVFVEHDDAGYSAVFPDFPGAGTSGDTFEEALARAEDNLTAHIDGLVQEKLDVPRPRSIEELKADSDLTSDWASDPIIASVSAVLPEKAEGINITIDSGLLPASTALRK